MTNYYELCQYDYTILLVIDVTTCHSSLPGWESYVEPVTVIISVGNANYYSTSRLDRNPEKAFLEAYWLTV
jgi:hypothetical protein